MNLKNLFKKNKNSLEKEPYTRFKNNPELNLNLERVDKLFSFLENTSIIKNKSIKNYQILSCKELLELELKKLKQKNLY